MFSRLINAIRYLFTGKLEGEAAPPDAAEVVEKATPIPANEASYLIMRDTHETADGVRTAIEVRSDGIHVATDDETPRVIPSPPKACRWPR